MLHNCTLFYNALMQKWIEHHQTPAHDAYPRKIASLNLQGYAAAIIRLSQCDSEYRFAKSVALRIV